MFLNIGAKNRIKCGTEGIVYEGIVGGLDWKIEGVQGGGII